MEKLTRRGLFKRVSIGAGATGLLAAAAVTGAHFGSVSATSSQAPSTNTGQSTGSTNTSTSSNPSSDSLAIVTNPEAGTLLLMNGDRELTVQNHTLVQTLHTFMR